MAEHEPHGAPFDEQALTEALDARSATVRDVAYGEGVQYSLGRGDARLEVFPRTGVTRLTASDVRVELFGGAAPQVSGSGVEFSRSRPGQDASLTVVPGGGIVFTLVAGGERRPAVPPEPLDNLSDEQRAGAAFASGPGDVPAVRAPERPQEPRSDTAGTFVPLPTADSPEAPQAAREPSSPTPPADRATDQQQPAATETEQERIALTGRLGRDPSFRTTKTGSLVGKFPLAVHREDGDTTWHTVLAFGTRAERCRAEKGQALRLPAKLPCRARSGLRGQGRPKAVAQQLRSNP